MIRFYKLLFVLLIFVFCTGKVFSEGGQERAGTSAAPELRIPVGAQYLAMSGSAIANARGLESIYWNPAGAFLDANVSANAMFSHRQYIADMSMSYAAVSANFGSLGTLGLSFRNLDIGDIFVTTMDEPDGTGEILNPTYFILGLTYSRELSDRISVGANFNIINESWANVSASGFCFDIGVQYRDLFVDGLSLGVVVKNLGGTMQYDGGGLYIQADADESDRGSTFYKVAAAEFELPSEFSLGVSYAHDFDEQNTLVTAATYVNNNYSYDDYKIGLEYSFDQTIFLRCGYLFTPQASGDDDNIFEDYTLGFGLNLMHFADLDIAVDYAYVPVEYFDANNIFSIRVNF